MCIGKVSFLLALSFILPIWNFLKLSKRLLEYFLQRCFITWEWTEVSVARSYMSDQLFRVRMWHQGSACCPSDWTTQKASRQHWIKDHSVWDPTKGVILFYYVTCHLFCLYGRTPVLFFDWRAERFQAVMFSPRSAPRDFCAAACLIKFLLRGSPWFSFWCDFALLVGWYSCSGLFTDESQSPRTTFSDELAHSEGDTQTLMSEPWLLCKRME